MSAAIDKMGRKLDRLCGVTTDPAMEDEHKGMASRVSTKVQESGGEAVRMHCIVHHEGLCGKAVQLVHLMNTVSKTIHIIRA